MVGRQHTTPIYTENQFHVALLFFPAVSKKQKTKVQTQILFGGFGLLVYQKRPIRSGNRKTHTFSVFEYRKIWIFVRFHSFCLRQK